MAISGIEKNMGYISKLQALRYAYTQYKEALSHYALTATIDEHGEEVIDEEAAFELGTTANKFFEAQKEFKAYREKNANGKEQQ